MPFDKSRWLHELCTLMGFDTPEETWNFCVEFETGRQESFYESGGKIAKKLFLANKTPQEAHSELNRLGFAEPRS